MTKNTTSLLSIKKQLRALRRKHAKVVAEQARLIMDAAKRLRAVEAELAKEAKAIAGKDYEQQEDIIVSFDGRGSIDYQLEIGGDPDEAGLEDILRKAQWIVKEAEEAKAEEEEEEEEEEA